MAVAADYRITTDYGQVAGYKLNGGFHRGVDRAMPVGTTVEINNIPIGRSGNTGASDGPHLHLGKFTANGTVVDPGQSGFRFSSAKVVTVAEDKVNGKYVRILGDGYYYVYCHLSSHSCYVGQILDYVAAPIAVPYEQQGEVMIADADNNYHRWNKLFTQIRGREGSRQEFRLAAVGHTWLRAIEILSDSPEADGATVAQQTGQVAIRDGWPGQIHGLLAELDTKNKQLAELQVAIAAASEDDRTDKEALQAALDRVELLSRELESERAQRAAVSATEAPTAVPGRTVPVETAAATQDYSWLVRLLARIFPGKQS